MSNLSNWEEYLALYGDVNDSKELEEVEDILVELNNGTSETTSNFDRDITNETNIVNTNEHFETQTPKPIKKSKEEELEKIFEIGELLWMNKHLYHARKILKRVSHNPMAQLYLFLLYHEDSVYQNFEKSIYWAQKAVSSGNEIAMNCLGFCYEKGIGVQINEERAFEYYTKSAQSGCIEAYINLVRVFRSETMQSNPSIQGNSFKALHYFQKIINSKFSRRSPPFLVNFTELDWLYEFVKQFSNFTILSKKFWFWILGLARENDLKEAQLILGKFLLRVSSIDLSFENLNFLENFYHPLSTPFNSNFNSTSPTSSPTSSPNLSRSPISRRNKLIKRNLWEAARWIIQSTINGSIPAFELLKSLTHNENRKVSDKFRGHIAYCIGKLFQCHHFLIRSTSIPSNLKYITIKKVEPLLTSWKFDLKTQKVHLFSWVECVQGRDINFQQSGKKQSRLICYDGAVVSSPLKLFSFQPNTNYNTEIVEDYENAIKWYQFAYSLGNLESQLQIALLLLKIPATKKQDTAIYQNKAIAILQHLVAMKYSAAAYQIARLFLFFSVDIRNTLDDDNSNGEFKDHLYVPKIQALTGAQSSSNISTASKSKSPLSQSISVHPSQPTHPNPPSRTPIQSPPMKSSSRASALISPGSSHKLQRPVVDHPMSNPSTSNKRVSNRLSVSTQAPSMSPMDVLNQTRSLQSVAVRNNNSNVTVKPNINNNLRSYSNQSVDRIKHVGSNSQNVHHSPSQPNNNSNSNNHNNNNSNNPELLKDDKFWKEFQKEEGIKYMIIAAENYVPAQYDLSILLEEFTQSNSGSSPITIKRKRTRSSSDASLKNLPSNSTPDPDLSNSKVFKHNILTMSSLSAKEWCLCAASKGWPPALYKIAMELEDASRQLLTPNTSSPLRPFSPNVGSSLPISVGQSPTSSLSLSSPSPPIPISSIPSYSPSPGNFPISPSMYTQLPLEETLMSSPSSQSSSSSSSSNASMIFVQRSDLGKNEMMKAIEYYQKAADRHYAPASIKLAKFFLSSGDIMKAYQLLVDAANYGCVEAQLFLSNMLLSSINPYLNRYNVYEISSHSKVEMKSTILSGKTSLDSSIDEDEDVNTTYSTFQNCNVQQFHQQPEPLTEEESTPTTSISSSAPIHLPNSNNSNISQSKSRHRNFIFNNDKLRNPEEVKDVINAFHWNVRAAQLGSTEALLKISEIWKENQLLISEFRCIHTRYTHFQLHYTSASRRLERLNSPPSASSSSSLYSLLSFVEFYEDQFNSLFAKSENDSSLLPSSSEIEVETTSSEKDSSLRFIKKEEEIEFLVVSCIAIALLFEKHAHFTGHVWFSFQWWVKAWKFIQHLSIFRGCSTSSTSTSTAITTIVSPTTPTRNPDAVNNVINVLDNNNTSIVSSSTDEVSSIPTLNVNQVCECATEEEAKLSELKKHSHLFPYYILLLWKLSNNKIDEFSEEISTKFDLLSEVIFASSPQHNNSNNNNSNTNTTTTSSIHNRSNIRSPRNHQSSSDKMTKEKRDLEQKKEKYSILAILSEFMKKFGLTVSEPIRSSDTHPIIIRATLSNDIKTVEAFINNFHSSEIRHDDITVALQHAVSNSFSDIKLLLIRIMRETTLEKSFQAYLRERAEKETLEINYIQEQLLLLQQLQQISEIDMIENEKAQIYEYLEELGPIRAATIAQDLKPVLKRIQPAELLLDHCVSFRSKFFQKLTGKAILKSSSLFKPLNQTIKLIDSVCYKYYLKNKVKYSTVIQSLYRIICYYEKKKDTICNCTSDADLLSHFQMDTKMYLPGSGVRLLTNEAAECLLPSSPSRDTGRVDQEYGTHIIRVYQGIHYKGNPHAPGVEFMVDSLNKIIAGQGSAPTELLKVYRSRHPNYPYLLSLLSSSSSSQQPPSSTLQQPQPQPQLVPYDPSIFNDNHLKKDEMIYIASKTVVGANLQFILEQHPEYITQEDIVDSMNFSAMFISGLLTGPHDGKPDNFMLELKVDKSQKVTQMSIVGIDNDIAFASPIVSIDRGELKGSHHVGIKNVLYFFPQMNNQIDQQFVLLFLKNIPEMIVIYWLSSILLKNQSYQQLIQSGIFTQEEFENLHLPIKFVKGTVISIYDKICRIQTELTNDPYISHNQLFRTIDPLLYYYYRGIIERVKREKGGDCNYIIESIQQIYSPSAPTVEDVILQFQTKAKKLAHKKRMDELKRRSAATFVQHGNDTESEIEHDVESEELHSHHNQYRDHYRYVAGGDHNNEEDSSNNSSSTVGDLETEDVFLKYLQQLREEGDNRVFDFEDKRITSVIEEVESFLACLDYSKYDYNTHILLFSHISDLKELGSWTVRNSSVLDYGLLVRVLEKLSNLTSIHLVNCSKMEELTLQSLENRFPRLIIKIKNDV